MEGCTATSSRHFIATSNQLIEQMLKDKNYRGLLKFVLETILHILRDKLSKVKDVMHLAKSSDDLVMVELCAVHSVITYPDFIQIVQVINVSSSLPTFKPRTWTA